MYMYIYIYIYAEMLSKSHDAVPRNVAGAVEQQAKSRLAVPPGAASFLVVMVKRSRQASMDHEPYVTPRFVETRPDKNSF